MTKQPPKLRLDRIPATKTSLVAALDNSLCYHLHVLVSLSRMDFDRITDLLATVASQSDETVAAILSPCDIPRVGKLHDCDETIGRSTFSDYRRGTLVDWPSYRSRIEVDRDGVRWLIEVDTEFDGTLLVYTPKLSLFRLTSCRKAIGGSKAC